MIYLMRHGQDDERFIGGWSDVELIDEGKVQVRKSALWLKQNLFLKRVMCSDVKRAVQTAEIVKEITHLDYEKNSLLREQSKGLLNGMAKEIAQEKYPEYLKEVTINTVYPKGECLKDLYNRTKNHLEEFLQLKDNTLLITHRGVINMFYYLLQDQELDMNKSKFNVEVASIHELDPINRRVRRIR